MRQPMIQSLKENYLQLPSFKHFASPYVTFQQPAEVVRQGLNVHYIGEKSLA